jgi:hypothetical protein
MIWLLTTLLILTGFISYIFFAPFYVEIDSERNLLRIRFHYLASARLSITDSSLIINVRIAGWRKQLDLLSQKKRKERPIEVKRKSKRRKISFHKLKVIVKSFNVNKCYFNLDLGNLEWNGILFPLFLWISNVTMKYFRINFRGENDIKLEIENNIASILWAFIFK